MISLFTLFVVYVTNAGAPVVRVEELITMVECQRRAVLVEVEARADGPAKRTYVACVPTPGAAPAPGLAR